MALHAIGNKEEKESGLGFSLSTSLLLIYKISLYRQNTTNLSRIITTIKTKDMKNDIRYSNAQ